MENNGAAVHGTPASVIPAKAGIHLAESRDQCNVLTEGAGI